MRNIEWNGDRLFTNKYNAYLKQKQKQKQAGKKFNAHMKRLNHFKQCEKLSTTIAQKSKSRICPLISANDIFILHYVSMFGDRSVYATENKYINSNEYSLWIKKQGKNYTIRSNSKW